MDTLDNLHWLDPCSMCSDRMAVPGTPMCIPCDVTLGDLVPDDPSGAA